MNIPAPSHRHPGAARTRVLAGWLSLVFAATLGMGGCDFFPGGRGVSRQDMRVLRAVVGPACGVEWNEIISDVPAAAYRAPSMPREQPNLQFGLDVDTRPRTDERWPRGALCKSVQVVDDVEIQQALAHETSIPPTWEHFRERFQGVKTLVSVSLPVYSEDGRRAVVYTAATCPYTCGNGFFHELVKGPTGWQIRTSMSAWAL